MCYDQCRSDVQYVAPIIVQDADGRTTAPIFAAAMHTAFSKYRASCGRHLNSAPTIIVSHIANVSSFIRTCRWTCLQVPHDELRCRLMSHANAQAHGGSVCLRRSKRLHHHPVYGSSAPGNAMDDYAMAERAHGVGP